MCSQYEFIIQIDPLMYSGLGKVYVVGISTHYKINF